MPWDWLSDADIECLSYILIHLVNKEQHCNVDFLDVTVTEVSQPIELLGILTAEMNRDNITMCLYTLRDERLLPG